MNGILQQVESGLQWVVDKLDGPLWDITVITLIITGLFFTISTGFVQIKLFGRSIKEILSGTKSNDSEALTSFQAFATGLASRVGVGNIGGVATAIALGGPGAVFWMWVMALIGMSSAFAESTLAQVFKTRNEDQSFRGGPAYYISKGLKAPWLGAIFALILVFTFGFAFNAVQSNSIVKATTVWHWDPVYVGVALVLLTAGVIFGGVKRVGKISSIVVPFMALIYLAITIVVMALNIQLLPGIFKLIITKAFEFEAMAGGIFGALFSQAMLMGIKRGLFSNEAGMGSAPNAAASADVPHPAIQGLVQMLGVFVDTLIVCSCTAFIILLSNNFGSADFRGVELTQSALQHHVGAWGAHFLALSLFLFCYTSIIGNYAYAESNIRYLKNNPTLVVIFRLAVLFFVYFGAVSDGGVVWAFADTIMAMMAMINLVSILLLAPIVWLVLKDYQRQLAEGQSPAFRVENYPQLLKKGVSAEIWK
ncbi:MULTISPECIES: alanine/glycine:cation symporter family protein [unclassified Acinetobacter]|uniref:alanine/glycine:cation symporter family protein n=1 Tax=unclassified Acinetobacter TaxID=196816 RepID=UPI0035B85781